MPNEETVTYAQWRSGRIREFVGTNPPEELIPEEHVYQEEWRQMEYQRQAEKEKIRKDRIDVEYKGCSDAWDKFFADNSKLDPVATPVSAWHFHHGILIERVDAGSLDDLKRTIQYRLRDITGGKRETQRVERLRNFRPVEPGTVTLDSSDDEIMAAHQKQVPHPEDWKPSSYSVRQGTLAFAEEGN